MQLFSQAEASTHLQLALNAGVVHADCESGRAGGCFDQQLVLSLLQSMQQLLDLGVVHADCESGRAGRCFDQQLVPSLLQYMQQRFDLNMVHAS